MPGEATSALHPGLIQEIFSMSKNLRQFVAAVVTGLTFAGFAAHVYADDASEQVKQDCAAQATDSGLQGDERTQFIQQCIDEASQGQGDSK